MIRREAIEYIAKRIGNNPIVSANGYISRDLFETHDSELNFYMIGSMGLASSIGLGLSIKNPRKKIFVFDGDGNILMNLGSLTTIGAIKPSNLIHIIFDNNSHESTGGQPTNTKKINLDKIAKAANYTVFKANTFQTLDRILTKINQLKGPTLILVKVENSSYISKRISLTPFKIRDRFMTSLNH